jgi:hypothetical protein
MFVVTSLNKTKSCSFFLFLQFMYSKLKKITFYIILAPLLNNPTSAPGWGRSDEPNKQTQDCHSNRDTIIIDMI